MTRRDPPPALRVLQLTDPHLMADPTGELLGVNTRDSFDAVLDQIQRDGILPDLILATGDLAQDCSEDAYRLFAEKLAIFNCPVLWLSGNHDDAATLERMAGVESGRKQLVQGGWHFILLDSSVPHQVHGELSNRELTFLDEALTAQPELPTLVALHHHPVDIGSRWMDRIGLKNRDAFWRVIDRHPQVKVVLWGHIHQELDQARGNVRLLASPSTCIQFTAGSDDFAVEALPPGYRWLELAPSGDCQTWVGRAGDFRFDLDINSSGY
ncbi:MAG: 3',5'-cyclic-AMP phosphodiesterase [Marinobacter sp.]|uniref:3',5'-cyclic-AMP phosphodiesterase n=1 Tax=Marinobacter sp. TaxID=50741 RepID=UPI00299E0091|nr:3',5'-cyclic-AMP phosphodiesterase [Marinobacter sp.]MDX1757539.1 3',5'-cyclic-AMP phosphodiesterase [Marinobacter sp.]